MLDSARGVLASLLWHSSACRGHSVLNQEPLPGEPRSDGAGGPEAEEDP